MPHQGSIPGQEGGAWRPQQTKTWGKSDPERGQPLCLRVCACAPLSVHKFEVQVERTSVPGVPWGWAGVVGSPGLERCPVTSWLSHKPSCVETQLTERGERGPGAAPSPSRPPPGGHADQSPLLASRWKCFTQVRASRARAARSLWQDRLPARSGWGTLSTCFAQARRVMPLAAGQLQACRPVDPGNCLLACPHPPHPHSPALCSPVGGERGR